MWHIQRSSEERERERKRKDDEYKIKWKKRRRNETSSRSNYRGNKQISSLKKRTKKNVHSQIVIHWDLKKISMNYYSRLTFILIDITHIISLNDTHVHWSRNLCVRVLIMIPNHPSINRMYLPYARDVRFNYILFVIIKYCHMFLSNEEHMASVTLENSFLLS